MQFLQSSLTQTCSVRAVCRASASPCIVGLTHCHTSRVLVEECQKVPLGKLLTKEDSTSLFPFPSRPLTGCRFSSQGPARPVWLWLSWMPWVSRMFWVPLVAGFVCVVGVMGAAGATQCVREAAHRLHSCPKVNFAGTRSIHAAETEHPQPHRSASASFQWRASVLAQAGDGTDTT